MADFTALKTAIQNAIKQNGNEEITGNILQDVLLAIVSTLGDGSINDLITALGSEATTRGNADATLQQNINAEAQARQLADSTLQGGINTVSAAITAINNAIGNGCVYAGIATPSSTPASGKVFYLALTAGTYTNYGGLEVSQGINILKNNGSTWSLDSFLGIDDAPTPSSNNLVKSGGVYEKTVQFNYSGSIPPYNIISDKIISSSGNIEAGVFSGFRIVTYEVKANDILYFIGTVQGGVQVAGLYSSDVISAETRIEQILVQNNTTKSYDIRYIVPQDGCLAFTINTAREYQIKISPNNSRLVENLTAETPTLPLAASGGKLLYSLSCEILNRLYTNKQFKITPLSYSSLRSGYGIDKNGEFAFSTYEYRKYAVTEGSVIGIKGAMKGGPTTGVYAFYGSDTVSSESIITFRSVSNKTGNPKTTYDEVCIVPKGAVMLAVASYTEYPDEPCLAYSLETPAEWSIPNKIIGSNALWVRNAYIASDGTNNMHDSDAYRTYCIKVESGQILRLSGKVSGIIIIAGVFSSMIPSTDTLIESIEVSTNNSPKRYCDYQYTIKNSGYLFICECVADGMALYFTVNDKLQSFSGSLLSNIRSQHDGYSCDNLKKKLMAQDEDLYVVLNGDSVTAWQSTETIPEEGVTNVPPVCDKTATAYQLWKAIQFGQAVYRRFDAGKASLVGDWDSSLIDDSNAVFTEVGSFSTLYNHDSIRPLTNPAVTTKQTQGASFPQLFTGWETQRNIPMRFSNTANASITFTIPAGKMKADFIFHAHVLGDDVTISTNRSNGVVLINDKPNDWANAVEANGCVKSLGYSKSAVQDVTGSAANDDNGVSNRRLHFKILDTTVATTITITKTSDTSKYIIYWGVSYWGTSVKPYALHLNDQGIGGMTIRQLLWFYSSNIQWSNCQLQIFQIPFTHYTFQEEYSEIKAKIDDVIARATRANIETVFDFPTSDISDADDDVWKNRTDYSKYMKWCILNNDKEIVGDAREMTKKVWENNYKGDMSFSDFLYALFIDTVHINDRGSQFFKVMFENILC